MKMTFTKKPIAFIGALLLFFSFTANAQYCAAGPSSTADSNVEAVAITGDGVSAINHTGCPGVTGVEDLTAQSVDLTGGGTYSLSVTFGTCGGNYGGAGEVWIDYDKNGTFDAGESIMASAGTPGSAPWDAPVVASFTVPATACDGATVMRVMQQEGGGNPLNPCATYSWGSVMDFTVNISGATSCVPPVVPGCADTPDPVDGATDIVTNYTLAWTAPTTGDPATAYDVYLGTTSGSLTNIGTVTGTSTAITGLTLSTTYYWQIVPTNIAGPATGCPEWSFSTLPLPDGPMGVTCTSTGANPAVVLTEEIDTQGGWTGDFGTANGQWKIDGGGGTGSGGTGPSAPHSGSDYMYYEASGGTTSTASAVSPAIDLSSGVDDAELSFWMHAFGVGIGTLNVGVGTDAAGPFTNEFTWAGPIQTANADAWHNVGVDLSAYVGQTIYVEFSHTGTGDYTGDMAIDLLEVTTCTSCGPPSAVAASAVTGTTATVSWTDGPGCSENNVVTVTPAIAGSPFSIGCGTGTIDLMGLVAGTAYTVEIANDCGAMPSSSVMFTTPCDAPTALASSGITTTGATITWVDGGGCGTEKTVTVTPAITGSPFSVACGTQTLSLTGLDPSTSYSVEVANDCGTMPSATTSFATLCETEVPDYIQPFDTFVPVCWDEADGGDLAAGPGTLGAGGWGANAGAVRINLYNTGDMDWILSPIFDLSAGLDYQLEFDVEITAWSGGAPSALGSDDQLQVVYSIAGGAWTSLVTIDASYGTSPAGGEHIVENIMALGAVPNIQFAFWATEGAIDDPEDNWVQVDNFQIREVPSCLDATDLTATGITATSANLSWTENNDPAATAWTIEYGLAGYIPGTGNELGSVGVSTTSFPLSSLMSNTAYDFYVTVDCAGGSGAQVGPGSFLTLIDCSAATVISDCGVTQNISLEGAGQWNGNLGCGFSTPGAEAVYSFTPTMTGVHNLEITAITTSGYIDYYWKEASGTCDDTGWNCINDLNFTGVASSDTPMNFTAGVEYLILGTGEGTTLREHEFQINCPPPVNNDCPDAVDISDTSVYTGSTENATDSNVSGCATNPDDDVWFSVTADGTGSDLTITVTGGVEYELFSGACGALTSMGCNASPYTLPTNSTDTYYVRCYDPAVGFGGGSASRAISSFTIQAGGALLPIELVSFTGYADDRTNVLEFSVAAQENVEMFYIERSRDGINNFEVIAETAAAGTTNELLNYRLMDETPLTMGYYRLVSADYDGKMQTSNVIAIERESDKLAVASVYPVPTNNSVFVDFDNNQDSDVQIVITDVAGRQVMTVQVTAIRGNNKAEINLASLSAGTYFMSLSNGESTVVERIIKN